ncbi:PREDICTED: LOB domain-containing protein 41-like [Nelumbo nucifera]|uniref:LOB domain-containing protein 41-like n=1 Tax=Nelumbo nucifera TaxID=4432 RepID=A0A1U8AE09_NELNU|nr:PREDICTED: LOB domain-containing protein 41-like [Nelumbo nucifera]
MRMSCNGCRVLRKGCSENCSIRPCLQWIKNPESQANATVFLAKFYGRAGLMNLINAGPEHLRPAIFRSLLYEACGRIVNPIYGSVGLLWSGNWPLCQAAVEAVLKGNPITQIASEAAVSPSPPMKAYDIRHVSKDENWAASQDLHKVKSRSRFKRSASKPNKPKLVSTADLVVSEPPVADATPVCNLRWRRCYPDGFERATSHESSGSHHSEHNGEGDSRETDSMFSVETVEHSLVSRPQQQEAALKTSDSHTDDNEVELELTLGFEPVSRHPSASPVKGRSDLHVSGNDTCKMELGLDYVA